MHFFRYVSGFFDVDLRRRNITASWNVKGSGDGRKDKRFSKMYINHYVTKSFEDYSNKRKRRAPNGDIRSLKFFNETDERATSNCDALVMPQVRARRRMMDATTAMTPDRLSSD